MKSLIKDDSAISYLLIVSVGVLIVVAGAAYNFISDMVDSITAVTLNVLPGSMTSDMTEGGNALYIVFKNSLIIVLVVLAYYIWNISQRPTR